MADPANDLSPIPSAAFQETLDFAPHGVDDERLLEQARPALWFRYRLPA
jgi:hypothetical protein